MNLEMLYAVLTANEFQLLDIKKEKVETNLKNFREEVFSIVQDDISVIFEKMDDVANLHMDNDPLNNYNAINKFLIGYIFERISHPNYSFDLASCNFWLF